MTSNETPRTAAREGIPDDQTDVHHDSRICTTLSARCRRDRDREWFARHRLAGEYVRPLTAGERSALRSALGVVPVGVVHVHREGARVFSGSFALGGGPA